MIELMKNGDTLTCRFRTDRLEREVAEQARARLSDLIDRGERRIELDLTGISFIDSAGLYLGANLQKRLGEAGSVRLSGLSPTLRWMFTLTQLDKVLEIRAAA